MNKKLAVVIPVFNEEKTIANVVKEWSRVLPSEVMDLLIVNDGSDDDTREILSKLKNTIQNLTIITKKNGGFGPAINSGYRFALKNKYEYIFQTDSDQQFSSKDFNLLWDKRSLDYPIIIGNRKKRRDPILRVFLSKIILRVLILLIFHKNIQDAGAPFRLIRADFLKYFLKFEEKDSAHPNVQMAIVANKILSIDVMHFNRKHEQVSWPIIKLLRFGLKLIDDIYLLWKKLKNRN